MLSCSRTCGRYRPLRTAPALCPNVSAALRAQAVALYQQGLARITPEYLLRQALVPADALELNFLDRREHIALGPGARLWLLAIGKAAAPMAAEAQRLLGARIAGGLVVTKAGFSLPGLPWPVHETGHPVPDARGVAAARAVEALLRRVSAADVVLVLMSGGASALLPAPLEGISLEEKQALVQLMLRTNMDIHEINTVRKAVSRFKGGGLAALAAPARVVGLYLSDVPGDNLSSIGSGPTVPEPVDFPAVVALLRGKGIWERVPASVRGVLERGQAPAKTPPTPPVNGLIGTNRHLLRAIGEAAQAAGFRIGSDETPTTGLNAEALPHLLRGWEAFRREHPGARRLCRVSGGETTVEVRGKGLGGRCQELAALAMPHLDAATVFLAAGSDGNDGPTDAAGGVVDRESWQRVQAEGIPYEALLADNDSYHLLERSGNLIKVPPTRNNVMDVHLFLGEGA
jgi:glycerate 2-kinase